MTRLEGDALRHATKSLLLAITILALTIGHHVYGAVIYLTPWRFHIIIFALPAMLVLVAAHAAHQRLAGTTRGWVSMTVFIWITLLVPILAVGAFEGGYNHVLKNVLYFLGVSDVLLERLYPQPMYIMPNDILFEMTGVLQFLVAVWLAYYLLQLWQESRSIYVMSELSN